MNLGKKFFSTLRGFDVYQQIGGYGRSVRVIYGEDDPIVSLDYMERLKTVYKDMELYILRVRGMGFLRKETAGWRNLRWSLSAKIV